MQENTVQTLIDYVKDLTGQTNASNAKVIRALNFTADEYSRIQITESRGWKRESGNHGDLSRVTATVTGSKASLETEMIAIEYVDIFVNGTPKRLDPVNNPSEDTPLDASFSQAGIPQYYDYDNHHVYFYPPVSGSMTARISYKRAHPRFSTDNLTQSTGVLPIDDEFLALGACTRLTIGSNDPSHATIRNMYEGMKQDIKDAIPEQNQDAPRRLRPALNSAFTRRSGRRGTINSVNKL